MHAGVSELEIKNTAIVWLQSPFFLFSLFFIVIFQPTQRFPCLPESLLPSSPASEILFIL